MPRIMRCKNGTGRQFWLFLSYAMILGALTAWTTSCSCGDTSDGTSPSVDDDTDDSPDDDTSDGIPDDDTTPEYDDDSHVDDDSQSDDDSTLPDDPSETLWDQDGLLLQRVWGGFPNLTTEAFVLANNGDRHVFASLGRCVVHYRVDPDQNIEKETLACFASAPAVAIDADDHLHVLYLDIRDAKLVYANNVIGAWTHEIVCDYVLYRENGRIQFVIDVDDQGYVHVGLEDAVLGGYSYATNEVGSWEFELLDPFGTTNIGNSDCNKALVVDAENSVHFVFDHYSIEGSVTRYARRASGGTWTVETAHGPGPTCIDLALDSTSSPVIVWRSGGIWVTRLTDVGWVDEYVADAAGNVFIQNVQGDLQIIAKEIGANSLKIFSESEYQWTQKAFIMLPELFKYTASHANEANYIEIAFTSKTEGPFIAQFDDAEGSVSPPLGIAKGVIVWPQTDSGFWGERLDVAFQDFVYTQIDEDTWRDIGHVWAARRQDEHWSVEYVGQVESPSLDMDSTGARFISATDPSPDEAEDSRTILFDDATGNWRERIVDTAPDYPVYNIESSIDLTPDDVINVVAAGMVGDISLGDLGVTWSWMGDAWHTDVWNWYSAINGDPEIRLLMAPDGTPNIICSMYYFNFFSSGRYIVTLWKTPSGWQQWLIDGGTPETEFGLGMDAVMDEDGVIYVTYGYHSSTGKGARLAVGGRLVRAKEELTEPDAADVESTAVALAPDGRIFVAYDDYRYYDRTSNCCTVHAMVLDGDNRLDKVVDWGGWIGGMSQTMSLSVDGEGTAHLFYGGEQSLWYAQFGDEFFSAE